MSFQETVQPDWQNTPPINVDGGINLHDSEDQIRNNELLSALNIRMDGNRSIGDGGYFPYHWIETTLTNSEIVGATSIQTTDNVRYKVPTAAEILIVQDDGSYHRTTISAWTSNDDFTIALGLTVASASGNTVYIQFRLIGTPALVQEVQLSAGTSDTLIACQDDTANSAGIVYRDTTTAWEPVRYVPTSGGNTTLSAGEPINETILALTSATGFSQYDYIRVGLDTGDWHACQITGIAGSNATISPPLPEAAAAAKIVQRVCEFTGAVDDRVVAVTVPFADDAIFTNGKDPIYQYDGALQRFSDYDATDISATSVRARYVDVFDNRVILLYVTEAGTIKAQRVWWTAAGSISDFTNGGSGDLWEQEEEIVSGHQLGPAYYIFKKLKGIYRMQPSQRLDRDFDFDEMISNHGTVSVYGVNEIDNNRLIIWDQSNLFSYTGDFGITRIGDSVRRVLYGSTGNLDTSKFARCSIFRLPETNELLLSYQAVGDTGPKNALRYKIDTEQFTSRVFPIDIWTVGTVDPTGSIDWAGATGTWASQTTTWSSAFVISGAAVTILGTDANESTYRYNQTDSDDNGTVISYEIITKEYIEDGEVRFDWMDLRCAGGTISIHYSTDGGLSWVLYGTVSAGTKIASHRVHKQVVVRNYRWKFSSTSSGFRVDNYRLRVAPETERD